MMKVLVLGASGATGRLVVEQLLSKGVHVIAMVRSAQALADINKTNSLFSLVEASISELSESDLAQYMAGSDGIVSCLGHNLTFKGVFGHPRRLVTDAVKKTVGATRSLNTKNKTKIILMNTTGNTNQDLAENPPFSQRAVIALLRVLLPPHVDNEQAADYLRTKVGQNSDSIEWVAVRPDGLVDEEQVSQYDIVPSPTRNVIFDAGKTSRINVADFMSELVINQGLWEEWKGKMPVIYNHA